MRRVRFSCLPEVTHYIRMYAIEAGVVRPRLGLEVIYTDDINRYFVGSGPELGQLSTGFLSRAMDEVELRIVAVYPSYRKRLSENVVLARGGSGVEGPQDLEGRRLGVPGMDKTTTVVALSMLKEYLGPRGVELVEASPRALLAKLNAGEVDAALLLGYHTVEALSTGRYEVVWRPYEDFAKRYGRGPINSLIAAQRDFAEEGGLLREAWEAIRKSCAYGRRHWEGVAREYVRRFRGGDESLLRAYVDWLSRSGFTTPTEPSQEDLEIVSVVCELARGLGLARGAPSAEELRRLVAS